MRNVPSTTTRSWAVPLLLVVLCMGSTIAVQVLPGISAEATPIAPTAYVANTGSNTVTPIALATNTPGSLITVGPVGSSPQGVALTPNGQIAYVCNVITN